MEPSCLMAWILQKAGNKELSNIRKDKIGFIFQDYNLLDTMTLQDNIALPLSLNGVASSTCIQKQRNWLLCLVWKNT